MRTTLTFTLDDDVVVVLKKLQEEKGISFKEAVNQTLRQGLRQKMPATAHRSYQIKAFNLGECFVNLDNIGEALAMTEGEDYR